MLEILEQDQKSRQGFAQEVAQQTLNYSLQREFKHEVEDYRLNKRIVNLLCDMGYVIKERDHEDSGLRGSRTSSLVKKTAKHMIIINYDYRRRIMLMPEDNAKKALAQADPEVLRKLQPEAFGSWLRRHGLLPPDMDLPEYDEEAIRKEYEEANSNPMAKYADHEDDSTPFEICLINKRDEGLFIEAVVHQSEVSFERVAVVGRDALELAKMSRQQREKSPLLVPDQQLT